MIIIAIKHTYSSFYKMSYEDKSYDFIAMELDLNENFHR